MPGELVANTGVNTRVETVYSVEQYDQPSAFYPIFLLHFELTSLTDEMDQIFFTAYVGINTSEAGTFQIDQTIYTPRIRPGSILEQLIQERKSAYPNMTGLYYTESFADDTETTVACTQRITTLNITTGTNIAFFDGYIDCDNGYRKWFEESFDTNFNSINLISSYQCNSCFSTDSITGSDVLLVLVGTITLYNTIIAILAKIKDIRIFKSAEADDKGSQRRLKDDDDLENISLKDVTVKNEYIELESSIK